MGVESRCFLIAVDGLPSHPCRCMEELKLSQAGNCHVFSFVHVRFLVSPVCVFVVQVLLHIRTEKGMGYPPAMAASDKYHGVAKFNVATGKQHKGVSESTDWNTGSAVVSTRVAQACMSESAGYTYRQQSSSRPP